MSAPSPFLVAHAAALRDAARLGPVLDLACGEGRHTLAAAGLGAHAIGIDRDSAALAALREGARGAPRLRVSPVRADLEAGWGIPALAGRCGAVLVFRFLFRPLCDAIVAALAPGGLLLYETFTEHQRKLGHGPRNPAFLLQDGELAARFGALRVLERWEGTTEGPRPEALARLAARRPG